MSPSVNPGAAPAVVLNSQKAEVPDRSLEVRRLTRNALSLINANPHIEYLGSDFLVENLARSQGLGADEVVILHVRIRGTRRHTLVCVPSRIWHSEDKKPALIQLKRAANQAGRGCVLVPEMFIQRQPRLGSARAIEQSLGVFVTAEDRLAILIHLVESSYSTLFDCACAIRHEAPFSAVLALVAEGVIRMSGHEVGPSTRIDLPEAGFWAAAHG